VNLGEKIVGRLSWDDIDWVHSSTDPRARKLHIALCWMGWTCCK
jgi:hypothetical protein